MPFEQPTVIILEHFLYIKMSVEYVMGFAICLWLGSVPAFRLIVRYSKLYTSAFNCRKRIVKYNKDKKNSH